jgi:hypothetical protein
MRDPGSLYTATRGCDRLLDADRPWPRSCRCDAPANVGVGYLGPGECALYCIAHVLGFLLENPYGGYLTIGHRCELVLIIKEVDDPLGVRQ